MLESYSYVILQVGLITGLELGSKKGVKGSCDDGDRELGLLAYSLGLVLRS